MTSHDAADPALVSVIIPAYNVGAYISETLQSVLAQTYQRLEIIVIDDGSQDNTADVVSTFHDPRLVYIHQGNMGLAGARNTGLRRARGSFIQFLDADDIIGPKKIADHVAFLAQRNSDTIVYGPARYFFSSITDSRPVPLVRPESFFSDLVAGRCILPIHSMLFPRVVFNTFGLFDERQRAIEDWQLWVIMVIGGVAFSWHETDPAYYRLRRGSLSADPRHMYRSMLNAITTLLQRHMSDDQQRALQDRYNRTTLLLMQYDARQHDLRAYWDRRMALGEYLSRYPLMVMKTALFGLISLLGGRPLWRALDATVRLFHRPATVQNHERQ